MSQLKEWINTRARAERADTLLARMGYRGAGPKARARLSRVMADEQLGLADAEYDFHLDSRGFVEALCRAVGLPPEDYQPELDAIEEAIRTHRRAYKPWLFADTGFKRSDYPDTRIFVLAALESERRITLPEDTWQLPWDEQLERARKAIHEHMAKTGGELPVWGTIRRYLYCYAEDRKFAFTVAGEALGDASGAALSRASLQVSGRSFTVTPSE